MKILLAEASSPPDFNLADLLQKYGHEVVEATDKSEVLLELQKVDHPELTIIDWPAADLDNSIVNQIHTLTYPHPQHIIVLTPEEQKAELLIELQPGIDDYLVKPFTAEELETRIALVNRLVEMQRQLDLRTVKQNQAKTDLQNLDDAIEILSDASFEAIFLSDRGICLNQNKTAEEMFGYTREEAIGRSGTDWIAPVNREIVTNKMLKGDTVPYEATGLRKDGSTFPAEIQGRMVKYSGRHVRITAMRDISQRKRAIEGLVASEQRFRDIIENVSAIAIRGYNEKRRVTFWNQASEQLYGYAENEALGRKIENLIIPETMRREAINLHRRWVDFGETIPPGRLNLIDKDGHTVSVYSSHVMHETPLGKEMFCLDIDLSPLNKVEAEKNRLEVQLHQKQKVEALGVMSAGIAHDFNNILAIILSNVELIELMLTANPSVQEPLQDIKKALARASETVKQILSFSLPEGKFEWIKIAPLIDETLKQLRATIPSSVDILKQIGSECRDLSGYFSPAQMQQVLIHLCNNAVHSMNGQGLLEVSLKSINLETKDLPADKNLSPGGYLNLMIKDNGVGINKDTLKKIFDPFFTTKPVNEGSGMGLSIVHGIIENHSGFITVDSVAGQGSTFQIYLPIIEKAENKPKLFPAEKTPRGNERILFVDDEELLVQATTKILAHQGFHVTAETSSIKALSLFQTNPEQFDLVITDQTMPALSGTELIAEMRKIKPNLLSILCTGNSVEVSEVKAKELGIQAFCLKPLSLTQLAKTVRKVLDGTKTHM